jgi:hypothetical protein
VEEPLAVAVAAARDALPGTMVNRLPVLLLLVGVWPEVELVDGAVLAGRGDALGVLAAAPLLLLPVLPDHASPVPLPRLQELPALLLEPPGARRLITFSPELERPGPITITGASIGSDIRSGPEEDGPDCCFWLHLLQVTLSTYSPEAPA